MDPKKRKIELVEMTLFPCLLKTCPRISSSVVELEVRLVDDAWVVDALSCAGGSGGEGEDKSCGEAAGASLVGKDLSCDEAVKPYHTFGYGAASASSGTDDEEVEEDTEHPYSLYHRIQGEALFVKTWFLPFLFSSKQRNTDSVESFRK